MNTEFIFGIRVKHGPKSHEPDRNITYLANNEQEFNPAVAWAEIKRDYYDPEFKYLKVQRNVDWKPS